MPYGSWSELREVVDKNGGVLRVKVGRLRDLARRGRLGPHVVDAISRHLSENGMRHLPDPLPHSNQDRVVRVYTEDSLAWQLVHAGLEPSRRGDDLVRRAVRAIDAEATLDRIRALVAPDEDEDDFFLRSGIGG